MVRDMERLVTKGLFEYMNFSTPQYCSLNTAGVPSEIEGRI